VERLQRILAARGIASRRAAEELIRSGRVSVDGRVVTELGTKADPVRDEIRVDGKLLKGQRPRYILLNKPRGYITTTKDERDRRTVMDLVEVPERVYPVGRLDRDTEGLLLLTNDGDVANRVMHPRYGFDKEYQVLTLSRPREAALQRLRDGLVIERKRVVPEEVRIQRETTEGVILKVVVHEGIHHLVRRMMEEVGIPIERLRRVRIGPLSASGIPVGVWRELTSGELNTLFEALRLDEAHAVSRDVDPRSARRAAEDALGPASRRSDTARKPARRTGDRSPARRRRGDAGSPGREIEPDRPARRGAGRFVDADRAPRERPPTGSDDRGTDRRAPRPRRAEPTQGRPGERGGWERNQDLARGRDEGERTVDRRDRFGPSRRPRGPREDEAYATGTVDQRARGPRRSDFDERRIDDRVDERERRAYNRDDPGPPRNERRGPRSWRDVREAPARSRRSQDGPRRPSRGRDDPATRQRFERRDSGDTPRRPARNRRDDEGERSGRRDEHVAGDRDRRPGRRGKDDGGPRSRGPRRRDLS
jgi:23S rRNA pseudouridine2605 synthase